MQIKKLSLVTIKQHGFYSGIENEEKVAMEHDMVEQYLMLKTKEDYPDIYDYDAIKNHVHNVMSKGWHSAQLHSGAGDYEVDVSDIDYIENL